MSGGIGRCSSNANEELFFGFQGAFHCLVEGGGDVAFVKHTTAFENTDGNNAVDAWAAPLASNSFRLLCQDGGVRGVQDFANCNLGKIPTPKVLFPFSFFPFFSFFLHFYIFFPPIFSNFFNYHFKLGAI